MHNNARHIGLLQKAHGNTLKCHSTHTKHTTTRRFGAPVQGTACRLSTALDTTISNANYSHICSNKR